MNEAQYDKVMVVNIRILRENKQPFSLASKCLKSITSPIDFRAPVSITIDNNFIKKYISSNMPFLLILIPNFYHDAIPNSIFASRPLALFTSSATAFFLIWHERYTFRY